MPLVERSEEEIARRWLSRNNFAAVDWRVIDKLTEAYSKKSGPPIFVFDPQLCGYRYLKSWKAMNRRSLLRFLSAAPVAAAAVAIAKSAPTTEPLTVAISPNGLAKPEIQLGFIRDTFYPVSNITYYTTPSHTHTFNSAPSFAACKKEIWDGSKFVAFDSAEGTAVLNKVLQS